MTMTATHKFTIKFTDLCDRFKVDFDKLEESLNDYPYDLYCEVIYPELLREFKSRQRNQKYKFDLLYYANQDGIDCDHFLENFTQIKSLREEILELIEESINMDDFGFDNNSDGIHFIIDEKDCEIIHVELVGDPDHLVRQGMNAYGMWDYDQHSPEDKQKLCSDFEIILREMCHYHEACNGSKPKLRYNFSWDNFYKQTLDADDVVDYLEKEFFEGNLTARLTLSKEEFNLVFSKYQFDVTAEQLKELLPEFATEHEDVPNIAKVEIHV